MSGGIEAAGDIATGMLIGRAVEDRAGGAIARGHPHGMCLNCGTALVGDYCHACGQSEHVHRKLHSLLHDLLHGVFHFEGKVWRTIPMLFTRPGSLTRRYIAGERSRFVSPLALFLFSVFLMVATFETVGGPISNNVNVNRNGAKLTPEQLSAELEKQRIDLKRLETERAAIVKRGGDTEKIDDRLESTRDDIGGLETAKAVTEGKLEKPLSNARVDTGNAAFDEKANAALKEPKLFLYKLQSSAYKFSWALIPISLPFIWLLFAFRRDVGPYDHAIFAIYSLSAMTLGVVALSVGAAIGLPGGMIATLLVLGPPFHMYKQLRGAYNLSRAGALWRTFALVIFAYVAGLLFFIGLLWMIAAA